MAANAKPNANTCDCAYCQTTKPMSDFAPSWVKSPAKNKKCRACDSVYTKLRTKWQVRPEVADYGTLAYYQRAIKFYTELHDLTNGFTRIPNDVALYASMSPTEFEQAKGKIISSPKFDSEKKPVKPPTKATVSFEKFNVKVTLEGLPDTVARLMSDICSIN